MDRRDDVDLTRPCRLRLCSRAGSWYLYTQHGLLFDVTFPLIAIFVTYMTLVFINYFREQADRRRIRSAFSRYLSPLDLVEQLANSPKKLVLGGGTRDYDHSVQRCARFHHHFGKLQERSARPDSA